MRLIAIDKTQDSLLCLQTHAVGAQDSQSIL